MGGALSRLGFAAVRDAALAMRAGWFAWVAQTMPGNGLKGIFEQRDSGLARDADESMNLGLPAI